MALALHSRISRVEELCETQVLKPGANSSTVLMSVEDVCGLLRTPAVGAIPEDDCITLYQQLGRVPDFALSERAYERLASNVARREKKVAELRKPRKRRRWF